MAFLGSVSFFLWPHFSGASAGKWFWREVSYTTSLGAELSPLWTHPSADLEAIPA